MPDQQSRLKRHLDASQQQIELFAKSLSRFLSDNIGRIVGKLKVGDATNAAKALISLESELLAAGLHDELDHINRLYGSEIAFIKQEFAKLGKNNIFSGTDKDTLETLITFDTSRINDSVQTYLGDSRATMMRAIIAGEKPDFQSLSDTLTPRLQANINTELTTSLSAFNRTVTLSKGKDLGFDKYIYLGPDDNVTRPFCQQRVGNTYTMKEIQGWDNGQGLPAAIYLGGYNCRHQLRPVE